MSVSRVRATRCVAVVRRRAGMVLSLVVVAAFPLLAAASTPQTAPAAADKPTIKAFQNAIDRYRAVHRQEEAKIGPLPKTSDPAEITNRQHRLGEAISKARAGAQPGQIFTPPVAAMLRRLIARDLRRRRPVDRHAFIVSLPDVKVQVNDFYPTTVPLATVPPQLLRTLPVLPEGLEYRFVRGALVLRDVDPNLVVDILPDPIPARYRQP